MRRDDDDDEDDDSGGGGGGVDTAHSRIQTHTRARARARFLPAPWKVTLPELTGSGHLSDQ